ncbi:hypothetical protein, partial [Zoogloea oryzae]
LGLVWQGNQTPACLMPSAHALTPDMRELRIDLRSLDWKSAGQGGCAAPGIAQMLRLRIQLPRDASLRIASVELLTTEPMLHLHDASIYLPKNAAANDIEHIAEHAQDWP